MLIMVFVVENIRESVVVSVVLFFSLKYLIGETFYIDFFFLLVNAFPFLFREKKREALGCY